MTEYDKPGYGPLDVHGQKIEVGDYVVVGSNRTLTAGTVDAIKEHECRYQGQIWSYGYSVGVAKLRGGKMTYSHSNQGADKFMVITRKDGNPPPLPPCDSRCGPDGHIKGCHQEDYL